MISLKNINFNYDKKTNKKIIYDLNFDFKEGNIYAILGKNGSGKSTLLNIMNGFLKCNNDSQIFINEKELKSIKIKERANVFTYIPQKMNWFYGGDVKSFLEFSFLHNKKCYENNLKKDEEEKIFQILKQFELLDLINRPMNNLSGGQRQMIIFCAAILQNTNILYLDEPMSAMDLTNQAKVLKIIKELKNNNKIIIFTTHNPNHTLKLNCEVLILNEGKLIDYGPSREIINKEKMIEIFGPEIKNSSSLEYDEITI
ncbi:ABC transporter ATP-binding protein [Metamycoplasma equirhinis]|uniref:ABC transporter ATP-binding protein n=1 Tax=Metamycoplasma equirhinis TaxID=92402 RepID=A0ABZ0PAZ0_9BACT|nr:ABC transporter ATP-binding protein [Metamycoplasma equirhinis]TPD97771.1 ABC transporter ATP-binding protein [Metamycoplasma equirhinis]WPB54182.1 ABC transporter ATP-binding protein [Metamycoplasma equirhinis]